MRSSRFPFYLFLSLLVASTIWAQQSAISGLVTDESGALVSRAAVTLTNERNGSVRTTTSNESGIYSLPFVAPGRYTVSVEAKGFKRSEQKGVVVETGQALSIGVRLQVGQQSEAITVDGSGMILNTTDASVSTVVNREFIEQIPLNGRTLQSLMTVVPGVSVVPTAYGSVNLNGGISVNGQRTEANYFMVDGLSANAGASASQAAGTSAGFSGSLPASTALGTTQSIVSLDALEEFRALTSTYSAEYGRTPGGQFSFTTRSGTNTWHGSVYDYLRNDKLNANNWFSNQARQPRTAERQNDFGGTLGGPLRIPGVYNGKDRTFFFFSYEGLRLRLPQAAIVTGVPTQEFRRSAPTVLQPFINAFPLPNGGPLQEGLAEFRAGYSSPSSINTTGLRVDHNLNQKVKLFARYQDAPSESLTRNAGNLAMINTNESRTRVLSGGITAALSPLVSLDVRSNFTWNDSTADAYMDAFGGATPLSLASIPGLNDRSQFRLGLFWGSFTEVRFSPQSSDQKQGNVTGTLTASVGHHMLKMGVDYRRTNTAATRYSAEEAAFYFTPAQVLANTPAAFRFVRGPGDAKQLYYNFSGFLQDEWRVNSRLSLSLGVRWEVNPAPKSLGDAQLRVLDQIDNLSTAVAAPVGTPLWKTQYSAFSPRFGLAYRLGDRAGTETVLRVGSGLFFDTGQLQAGGGYFVFANESLDVTGATFPLSTAAIGSLPVRRDYIIHTFDPHLKLPSAWHWNATVQQALGVRQSLQIGYVGSAGRDLLRNTEYQTRTNPVYRFIAAIQNRGTSDYNALQVQYDRKLTKGLQVLGAYTWSHSLDTDSSSLRTELLPLRASSDFDIRHNFQLAVNYSLPGASPFTSNWSLSARVAARSALAVDVLSSSSSAEPVTGRFTAFHPNLGAGVPLYLSDANAPGGRRINFNAFTSLTAQEGNLGRNALRGFNSVQADIALQRNFSIWERLSLQVRAEAFNVLNRANFGAINNQLSSGASLFGTASNTLNSQLGGTSPLYQMGGPRSMQLALKFQF